jgi:transcription initiation factor TFIIIB Brf1 subunit/transcription initiation factor TFIIB
MANDIYQQLNLTTKRGRQRRKLIFYCVIKAYRELGIVCDPKVVAKEVGIKTTDINKAMNIGNEYSRLSGNNNNGFYHKPQDFIPEYCKQLMIPEDCTQDILRLTSNIIEKQPSILENYPQILAAAIILYYLTTHGVNIDIEEFSRMFLRSPVTIQKLVKVIADVDQV